MSVYDDSTRLEMLALRDELVSDFQADGLIFAEHDVELVTITRTGGDEAQGIPPTETPSALTLTPRPTVAFKEQWRVRDGVSRIVGNALLTVSRAAVTEAQLKAAAYLTISGVKYTLVAGEIDETPLDWKVVIQRTDQ